MRIEPVAYLEWAKLHKRGRINLSPSGITDRTPEELGFGWPAGLLAEGLENISRALAGF